jgi:nucleoside-diphosphate-sugar epimerase
MTSNHTFWPIKSALVTGATGLLGNNLARLLVSHGVQVKALVRSREKAEKQLASLPVEIVVGEMTNVSAFAKELHGIDVIFHTAAYFRDNYKGGKHWKELFATNVLGTAQLFSEAYKAGVRRIVHTSSVAVLSAAPGKTIDETMRRNPEEADDYYRSKILADRKVDAFLETHTDMQACMVLPGWMVGPGDGSDCFRAGDPGFFASQAARNSARNIFRGGRARRGPNDVACRAKRTRRRTLPRRGAAHVDGGSISETGAGLWNSGAAMERAFAGSLRDDGRE